MRSFLNRMRGYKNRTSRWQIDPARIAMLAVDLTAHRFGGVAVGEPIEKLSFLGAADNYYQQDEIYDYGKWGFYLVEASGRLEEVVFLFEGNSRRAVFTGRWLLNGRECALDSQTAPREIRRLLGEPSEAYGEATGELIWIYRGGAAEWEFAWLEEETLQSIEMRSRR
jgi:hypothetical protein